MGPKELKALLATCIPTHLPVLIKGAPGVGKSDIVAQAAKDAKADCILFHPVVSDPTDFKGLPAIVNNKAEFLPYGDLSALVEANKPTIAFLDDLGQAPAVVQAAAMQLILARRVNGHHVSPHVTFFAATNRREDRAGVTGILEPVKSRFATIIELVPTLGDWEAWALLNGVPAELIAFLRFRPALFTDAGTPSSDIVNRPSPRTITNMGKLYAAGIDSHEVLKGAVGEGFATEFVGFLRVWRSLPSLDAILANPKGAPVPTDPATLFSLATALPTKGTAKNCGAVVTYLTRLPDEYSVLGIRDLNRTCREAQSCKEFVTWAVAHQDILT